MKKFGLLGYPLGHSISDFVHRRIFELCGLTDCEYDLYEVEPTELALWSDRLKQLHGFNVTIPYKSEIIPYLDRLDTTAAKYGAVNCVKFVERSYEHIGYNTDAYLPFGNDKYSTSIEPSVLHRCWRCVRSQSNTRDALLVCLGLTVRLSGRLKLLTSGERR